METLRRVIAKINTQLADLTASQRLAIGLCGVLIVGSFLWLLQWSVAPDYVRLLEEPMTTDQIALATEHLPEGRYKIAGDSVFVSPQDRHELFWKLQNAGALPADTSITFAKLIEDDSPFRPESENRFRRRVALQNELAKVIASSRMVKSAEVFITDTSARRINAPNLIPTASVKVTFLPGRAVDENTVKACASLIAGAVPGLLPHNISVIDGATLRTFQLPDPEDAFFQGQLTEKKKHERHLQEKVRSQLSYIPGVHVSISVQLDPSKKHIREIAYAEPAVAEELSVTNESRSGGPSGESGVGPNVGQSLAGGPGAGVDTTEESTTKYQDQPVTKEVTTQYPPFAVLRSTASIGIPRSYIAGVLLTIKSGRNEPTQQEIDQQFDLEKQRVHRAVKNLILARSDADVTVNLYLDLKPGLQLLPDGTVGVASGITAGTDLTQTLIRYAPEGGLALLAIIGLVLLTRLVRKSARDADRYYADGHGRSGAGGESATGDEVLTVSAASVGMAQPSEGDMLEAQEVDEEVMRTAQMTEQVVQLVEKDSAAVASMMRRWTETPK